MERARRAASAPAWRARAGALGHDLAPRPRSSSKRRPRGRPRLRARRSSATRGHRRDDSLGRRMGISRATRPRRAARRAHPAGRANWRPEAGDVRLAPLVQPATGLSSETIFAEVDWPQAGRATRGASRGWCACPPTAKACSPRYDLAMQGAAPGAVSPRAGVPAVVPLAVEEDERCVGAPFLVMPRLAGRVVRAEQPYLRRGGWPRRRPRARRACTDESSTPWRPIHRLDWEALAGGGDILAARGAPAPDEDGWLGRANVEHWARYLAWAGEGTTPEPFRRRPRLVSRAPARAPNLRHHCCGATSSSATSSSATTWRGRRCSTSRWRSIGPAEVDLAWFVVLHDMAVDRCGGDLPGFPGRPATVAAYEAATGPGARRPAVVRGVRRAAQRAPSWCAPLACWPDLGVDDSWLTHENPTIDVLERLTSE